MLLTLLAWTLLVALLLMLLAPETWLAKAAREMLVVAPARFLLDLTWTKALRLTLLTPILVAGLLAGPQMVAMLVMMGGDLAAVELMLVIWAMAVSGGLAGVRTRMMRVRRRVGWRRERLPLRFGRSRSRRQRHRKPVAKKPESDDAPSLAFA